MIILPHKEKLIRENFIEFSFNKKEENYLPDFNLFKKLNSADQYYLAQNFNWDDGVDVLKWIIEDPKCDKGTASLIFWNSAPDYYLRHSAATIPDYEKATFELLKTLVEKFNSRIFKNGKLKFDPGPKVDEVNWDAMNSEWVILDALKRPTGGFTPISFGLIQDALWQWRRNKRLVKRNKKRQKRASGTTWNELSSYTRLRQYT